MLTSAKILFLIIFLHVSLVSFAQVPLPQPDTATASHDTIKEFEIMRGPSMRSINIDSATTLQTIAGGAVIRQGTTIFSGDSIVINPVTHVVEAFGHVHINQADSVQTYSQYLKYIGTEKTAYLKKDVRLEDKKSTLYTQDLDYNLHTGIGNYHTGGKVINGKTTITSNEGTYYADTKDVYFKNNVEVIEPLKHITTDSLLYNMKTQGSNFSGNTHIITKEADIYTTQGTYDFNTGNALFTSRSTVKDSSGRVYVANNMAMDDKSGSAQLEGNALISDTTNGFIVLANQIFLNKKNNSFLATRKPVLIIKQKSDSIYVAADTIFSGYSTMIKKNGFILKRDSIVNDSVLQKNRADTIQRGDSSTRKKSPLFKNEKDSSYNLAHTIDSLNSPAAFQNKEQLPIKKNVDSANNVSKIVQLKKDSTTIDSAKAPPVIKAEKFNIKKNIDSTKDTSKIVPLAKDSVTIDSAKTPRKINKADSNLSLKTKTKPGDKGDDSSRYFLAFHHVRIFSDSLQSICDSLFFSAKDSVFRLFYDPIIWSGHSQITGDTIYLYTKNKKPERLFAFERGMIVNKTTQGFYNQISGKTINGYFINGAIDYMRVKGSQAESVYYAQDNDSAYVGMNRATGDVIDLYFKNDDLKKVLFVNEVKGKLYPMRRIPEDQRFLKDFIWLNDKRPKNKLELFE
jgi:OstA-like protein